MARIRSTKPEFWSDRKLARLASRDARMLYMGLWNMADEWARVNGDPQWLKGQIFPYEDDIDAAVITRLLTELANPKLGAVVEYEADGDPYLHLPKLATHQRLEPHKVPSRLPAPPLTETTGPPDPAPSGSGADLSARGNGQSAQGADVPGPDATSPALLYVAGSREHVAGGRDARATAAGNDLLTEHLGHYRHKPPRAVIGATGRAIDQLLDEGTSPALIAQALATLRTKPRLSAGALPHLVHEIQATEHPPDDARVSTSDARVASVERLRREARAQDAG